MYGMYMHTVIFFPHLHTFNFQTGPLSVPLGVAAEEGHTQTLDRLLKGGSNINHQDKVRTHVHVLHEKNFHLVLCSTYFFHCA